MKNTFLITVTFLCLIQTNSVMASNFELAEKYIASYSQFDIDTMATFYSDDAEFRDLTSEKMGVYSFNMIGKQNIIEKFKKHIPKTMKISYKINTNFESGGHHVFIGQVTSKTESKGKINYSCSDVVTILKIVGNKNVSHIDYANYPGFAETQKTGGVTCQKF